MKKLTMIVLCFVCVLLMRQTFAQSGESSVSLDSKDKVGNRITGPSLPEGKNLSFGGKFTGTEDSFTFGLIADRHGGNPLVGWPYFEQAIREMNFLHPDFVIMPGDLIDGYIRREGPEGAAEDFNEQFDLFAHFADKLEMPLYFVAGNHDLSNNDMKEPFLRRFGKIWYSFDYRSVHFIALCTEAQPGGKEQQHHFTDEQVEWAISDISASKEARHTVVFMHYPAWYSRNRETLMYRQWMRIEETLKGRKYTVIAGHTHDLSTTIRNGRPYYVMATSGGSQIKPHSFYHGNTHHIGLVKMEGDSLYLSILELGATHNMEQVSKTRKSAERIKTIHSFKFNGKEFETEFSANVTNSQTREILAEFSLQGLSPKGWRSSAGDQMIAVIAPGDSAIFQTVLTVSDPLTSYPPLLNITAKDNGLKLVAHSDEVPVFKKEDYITIMKWYSAAPFDGSPMTYKEAPFDPRRTLPAMFKDYGPETRPWTPDDEFGNGIDWKEIVVNERGRVDFGKVYGSLISPVGYAITFVDSPNERLVYLRFAVNDYGRIWLNGETVGEDIFFWEDGMAIIPVWLKKGRNNILVKSANWSNNWYFVLQLSDPDHSLIF
jgi:hypothetical protein